MRSTLAYLLDEGTAARQLGGVDLVVRRVALRLLYGQVKDSRARSPRQPCTSSSTSTPTHYRPHQHEVCEDIDCLLEVLQVPFDAVDAGLELVLGPDELVARLRGLGGCELLPLLKELCDTGHRG